MTQTADEYFQELIPPPSSLAPNFEAWVKGNIQPGVDLQLVIDAMPAAFDIDLAVGDQLDVLGEQLGVSRELNFQPDGGINPILDDDTYRVVLKSKIILNQWNGTKPEIYAFWQVFLSEYPVLIVDNQDMTMDIIVLGMPNSLDGATIFALDMDEETYKGFDEGYWQTDTIGLLRQLVVNGYFTPKPAGVLVSYAFNDDVIFAFDYENDLLKGFDEGSWASFV